MDGETKQIFRIEDSRRLAEANRVTENTYGLPLDLFFSSEVRKAREDMCGSTDCRVRGELVEDNNQYTRISPEVAPLLDLTEYVGCIACDACVLGNNVRLSDHLHEQMKPVFEAV